MSDSPSLQDLLEVQRHFGLPSPALVEKDWYVVRALAAIGEADTGPFRLVFGGGTALGRAHGLLNRMSEDIDLKIVSDGPPQRAALRRLREAITTRLLGGRVCVRSGQSRTPQVELRRQVHDLSAPLCAERTWRGRVAP